MAENEKRSWERAVRETLDGQPSAVAAEVEKIPVGEIPRVFARLDPDERIQLLGELDARAAAAVLEHLPDSQSADVLGELEPEVAARIVAALASNDRADILGELEEDEAIAILRSMTPEAAAQAEKLANYPETCAGGLMITEFLAFRSDVSVSFVLDDLRANADRYRRHDVQYVYVVDEQEVLSGVLPLRDLVLAPTDAMVIDSMIRVTDSVAVDAPLEILGDFFSTRPYRGAPVVDADGKLVGVVRHADVAEAVGDQAASDLLKAQGIVGGEELRTMPVLGRAWRRLSWLSINVVLNILAASVIAFYQDTLAAVIVLAVFLPIISDMSGCTGNQAVAVSMRELTMGIVRPSDALRVWRQELSVGVINGLALGIILAIAAYLWKGNIHLSLVVGSALAINSVVAVSLGGLVPLLLRGMRMDPALASGPVLTTVTDMCGFFLVLSLASATLGSLPT